MMAIDEKGIETRGWRTSYRGPIAIHAAKGFPSWALEACWDEPFYSVLRKHDIIIEKDGRRFIADHKGKIVAVGELTAVERTETFLRMSQGLRKHEIEFGDYAPGRYGFVIQRVRRLVEPVPCRGALSLWDIPPDVLAQVQAQIGRGGV